MKIVGRPDEGGGVILSISCFWKWKRVVGRADFALSQVHVLIIKIEVGHYDANTGQVSPRGLHLTSDKNMPVDARSSEWDGLCVMQKIFGLGDVISKSWHKWVQLEHSNTEIFQHTDTDDGWKKTFVLKCSGWSVMMSFHITNWRT